MPRWNLGVLGLSAPELFPASWSRLEGEPDEPRLSLRTKLLKICRPSELVLWDSARAGSWCCRPPGDDVLSDIWGCSVSWLVLVAAIQPGHMPPIVGRRILASFAACYEVVVSSTLFITDCPFQQCPSRCFRVILFA